MCSVTIHDSSQAFKLKIQGEISGQCLRETELCWQTAASTIGEREFIVEVAAAPPAEAGKGLFTRMYEAGARFVAATPAAAALIAEITGEVPASPVAARQPGLLSRIRARFGASREALHPHLRVGGILREAEPHSLPR